MKNRNKEQGTRNKVGAMQAPGFRGLLAWQKADELASGVYRAVSRLPADHRWLAVQAMRAAISVPANIAEGYGRGSLGDYLRFLDMARGSLAELEYYLLFIEREGLLPGSDSSSLQQLREETGRLVHGLWKSLKQKTKDGGWDHGTIIREQPGLYSADPSAEEHDA